MTRACRGAAIKLLTTTAWAITTLDTFPRDLVLSWRKTGGLDDAVAQRLHTSYVQGTLQQTSLPANSMDVVLAFNVLHQVADLRPALAEVSCASTSACARCLLSFSGVVARAFTLQAVA